MSMPARFRDMLIIFHAFFFYKLTDPGGHDRKRIGFQREKTKEEYEQIKYG